MKKRWVVGILACVLLAFVIIFRDGREPAQTIETTRVERGDVYNEVSVTGHLKPLERIDLAFLVGGRIGAVYVEEGTTVEEGDMLARLEAGVLESQVREAEARLARERALEADILTPLRSEERAVKDTAVAGAEASLAQAEQSGRAAIARAYTYADDAVREKADELFYESRGPNPKFGTTFTYGSTQYSLTADAQTRAGLTTSRTIVEEALNRLAVRAQAPSGDIQALLSDTDTDLRIVETFLNDLARVVNKYIQTDSEALTVYDGYQTSVASARSAISTARSDVLAVRKEHQNASTALATSLRDLELSLAGASSEALTAQRASVALAEYGVTGAGQQLRDGVLYAPFAGTVTNFDLLRGETITAYTSVGQLIADDGFELEVFIPEADIASVKLGDMARVTFDAFEITDIFTAKVVRIALSETIREGVPTYKTTLVITARPDDAFVLRSGMTADIDIVTDSRENVIYIPSRSIVREDGRTFVRLRNEAGLEERVVVPGLRGSDGFTEIISGLVEGEEVVLFVEEP